MVKKLKGKTISVRDIGQPPKTYVKYTWPCSRCHHENEETVLEITAAQYHIRSLGPMQVKKKCNNCDTEHEVRVVFEMKEEEAEL